jgi:AraC family transcriptional regulator
MQLLAPNESFGQCLRRVDACGTIVRDTRLAPSTGVPRHAHATPYVCVVLDGRYTEQGADTRGELECATGSLLTHAAGHAHANRVGVEGARCVNIELDEAMLADGPLRALVPFLREERHLRLPVTLAPLRRLADALAEDDELAALQVHAAALSLLCAAARTAPPAAATRRGAVVDRVVEFLESDLAVPPSMQTLARLAGLHPHHLMRAFRQQRGETIGGYLRRRRLEIADAELRRVDLPLAEIALRAGFCDQAHFTRAYRRQFGVTPGLRRRTC